MNTDADIKLKLVPERNFYGTPIGCSIKVKGRHIGSVGLAYAEASLSTCPVCGFKRSRFMRATEFIKTQFHVCDECGWNLAEELRLMED